MSGNAETNPSLPAAERIIARQAMSQAESCGQSSLQHGIEAMATPVVKATAG
ncbi:MAG: hypothetical protein R3D56_01660 [Paracoccaceae bacterium]|jgi:hypothetical protein